MQFDWTQGHLAEGLHLYNTAQYFAAHEAWESVWLHAPHPEKKFLQALIQITAAMHHTQRSNNLGATRLLTSALAKLEPLSPNFGSIHLDLLRTDLRAQLDTLSTHQLSAEIIPPRIQPSRIIPSPSNKMTEEDPIPIPEPAFEGDFLLNEVLSLESGELLANPTLHYAVYGKLNAARSNAVLVCHALSGSARVGDWWPQLFLPGDLGLLDLERDCVIGINIFGSCYGSTGPSSIDPATGKPYGPTFPLIGIRDIVRAQARLIDHLGIHKLKLAIGASIGGMQVLEWAILFPERVARAVSIGVAPLGAMGLGLNHLQRQAIMLDPAWHGGVYAPGHGPEAGLALARALGMISYKSVPLFEERFARRPNRYGDENPYLSTTAGQNGRFDIAGYLDYQGGNFISRFDANSYISITRTMDIFDPVRAHETPFAAYACITAHLTMVGISTDWLFPPEDVRSLAAIIKAAGTRCDYREMASNHGHDAFLAEPETLVRLLTPIFE